MLAGWPLVARGEELRRIAAAVGGDAVRGLVVSGPAGVGKTSLLRVAVDDLARAGLAAQWVQGSQAAASLPFGAVAHLVPELPAATGSQVEVLHRTRAALLSGADAGKPGTRRRVLVAVDDAQWLDAASAALIAYLVASATAAVLLTVRSEATAPDAIQALIKSEQLARLELEVLSGEAVAELLTRLLAGQVDPAAARELWRLSEGNPLLVRELVDDARRRGALREQAGLWRLVGLPASPRRLADVVGARLAALEPATHAAACDVAFGEPLEAALLEAIADAAGLEALEHAGLLAAVLDVDGRRQHVRLVHPLYSEALRAGATPLQARARYRRLADALQATGARRRGDVLRLATWRLRAGQGGDPDAFLSAALRAQSAFDHQLAETLARAALQSGAGFPAKLALSIALRWQARTSEATQVLAGWQTEASSDAERAQAALSLADTLAVGPWQPERVAALLDDAQTLVSDPRAKADLVASRADSELFQWRIRHALQTVAPLLADDRQAPEPPLLAVLIAVAAATLAGRSQQALATAQPVIARLPHSDDFTTLFFENTLLAWSCVAHAFAGQLPEARRLAAERHQIALDRRIPELQAFWALARGLTALLGGQVATAARWLHEAAVLSRAHLQAMGGLPVTWSLGCLAEANALRGELTSAETALADAHGDDALPAVVPVAARQLGQLWLTAARGELTAARQLAAAAARTQRHAGAHAFEAVAVHDAVRLGATATELARHAERLTELTDHVDGTLIGAFADHAQALLDHDAARLQNVGAQFERLGLLLHAAEAAAELADLHRHAGRRSSTHAAGARARTLVAGCEGACTPALALAKPLPLTPRELEIATLAAQGLSNRQIAERLVTSVRTVDNHLHRSYGKLGITNRSELKAIIAP